MLTPPPGPDAGPPIPANRAQRRAARRKLPRAARRARPGEATVIDAHIRDEQGFCVVHQTRD